MFAPDDGARHRADQFEPLVAAIGTGDVFSKGRDFGAWTSAVQPTSGPSKTVARTFAASAVLSLGCLLYNKGINFTAVGWILPISMGTSLLAGAIYLATSGDIVGFSAYQAVTVAVQGVI
jgi:hypothetical protein